MSIPKQSSSNQRARHHQQLNPGCISHDVIHVKQVKQVKLWLQRWLLMAPFACVCTWFSGVKHWPSNSKLKSLTQGRRLNPGSPAIKLEDYCKQETVNKQSKQSKTVKKQSRNSQETVNKQSINSQDRVKKESSKSQ